MSSTSHYILTSAINRVFRHSERLPYHRNCEQNQIYRKMCKEFEASCCHLHINVTTQQIVWHVHECDGPGTGTEARRAERMSEFMLRRDERRAAAAPPRVAYRHGCEFTSYP